MIAADAVLLIHIERNAVTPITVMSNPDPEPELLERIIGIAKDMKAINPVILDLREISNFTDYFVIMSADSGIQRRSIAREIYKSLKANKILPVSRESAHSTNWMIHDYIDVVIHIFSPEVRCYYNLEELWGDAEIVEVASR